MKKILFASLIAGALMARIQPTPQTYGAYEDFDRICKAHFGQKARVTRWKELKLAYEKAADKKVFVTSLGFDHYDQSFIIDHEFGYFEDGDRHYIVTFHDHTLPTNYAYLVHDTIDDHLIDLGSWRDIDYPVLCTTP